MPKSKHASNILVEIKCDYISSIKIPFFQGANYNDLVNDQLMGFENARKGLRVKLVITTLGVKIYRKKIVRLGHSTAHILFSSCLPSKCLFAYITKSYSAERIIDYQAHVFKVFKSNDLRSLSEQLERCFRANSFLLRTKSFEECDHFSYKQRTSRTWSKSEHYKGHDGLDYVKKIKRRNSILAKGDSGNNDKDLEKETVKTANLEVLKVVESEDLKWLDDYDVIELDDLFCVKDEYYCTESLSKYVGPLEFDIDDVYLSEEKICQMEEEQSKMKQPSWLLPKGTSPEIIEKNLLTAPIGSYFVAKHRTRENQFIFYLKVPKHVIPSGLMECVVLQKKSDKYNLQGFSDNFESLQALVEHYGSIHNCKVVMDGKDHTDSSSSFSSLNSSLVSPSSPENKVMVEDFYDVDDYEVFECHQSLFDEIQELQAKLGKDFTSIE